MLVHFLKKDGIYKKAIPIILQKSMLKESGMQKTDIVIDSELLTDFANCKYKASQRIDRICIYALSEIDNFQKCQREKMKERWFPAINDEYLTFNGTISSFADLRSLSSSVFGNIRLKSNKLQCSVDGIEKGLRLRGQQQTYFPILVSHFIQCQ
jgi:hypothetical protein